MERFFGWVDVDEMWEQFREGQEERPRDFPQQHEIIFSYYSYEDYEGDAFVLYHKDGRLFEVHGGHCSCYGLEGQWDPEETTYAALSMRPWQDVERYVGVGRVEFLMFVASLLRPSGSSSEAQVGSEEEGACASSDKPALFEYG